MRNPRIVARKIDSSICSWSVPFWEVVIFVATSYGCIDSKVRNWLLCQPGMHHCTALVILFQIEIVNVRFLLILLFLVGRLHYAPCKILGSPITTGSSLNLSWSDWFAIMKKVDNAACKVMLYLSGSCMSFMLRLLMSNCPRPTGAQSPQ